MSELEEMITNKNKLQEKIVTMLSEYCYKYMKKVYSYIEIIDQNEKAKEKSNSKGILKKYQTSLIKISEWSDSKVHREYNKFLKWLNKKYKYSEDEFGDIINEFIIYTIRIVINKYNIDVLQHYIKIPKINLQEYFYKCLKRSARYYYENPKYIKDSKYSKEVDNIIISVLHMFIPLQDILNFIETNQDKKEQYHNYNFDDTYSCSTQSNNSIYIKSSPKHKKIIVQKEHNSNDEIENENDKQSGLHYISSEQLDEYDENDKQSAEQKRSDKSSKKENGGQKEGDIENEKEINVPRFKKPFKFVNNKKPYIPRQNELDENFFSD